MSDPQEHMDEARRLSELPLAADVGSLRAQAMGLQLVLRDVSADLAQAQADLKEAQSNLSINASMLARQCDLAREAESKAMQAEQQLAGVRAALREIGAEMEIGVRFAKEHAAPVPYSDVNRWRDRLARLGARAPGEET